MNTENLLKQILHPNNLNQAYLQVKRNKGAAGVDGMTINELGHYLKENGEEIKDQIRTRSYQPKPVKRIEIPKADGGVRKVSQPWLTDSFNKRWLKFSPLSMKKSFMKTAMDLDRDDVQKWRLLKV